MIDLLEAEESAESHDASNFDVLTNNCVHYASKIWRHLGVHETEDLADFIVANIINDENVEVIEHSEEEDESQDEQIKALEAIKSLNKLQALSIAGIEASATELSNYFISMAKKIWTRIKFELLQHCIFFQ